MTTPRTVPILWYSSLTCNVYDDPARQDIYVLIALQQADEAIQANKASYSRSRSLEQRYVQV